ncbi:MAG TPA: hypothetical protein VH598_13375, partial [Verrucomicrobiae bacterium]|nr:hypothetical protein [Verrucomicrobiae bacterium]
MRKLKAAVSFSAGLLGAQLLLGCHSPGIGPNTPAGNLAIGWTNNILTVTAENIPGGKIEIWYLEAFCHSGANDRDWRDTVLPHKTWLVSASPDGKRLEFLTMVTPSVEVRHVVTAGRDEINFDFTLTNRGEQPVDLQWFEPACIRVAAFTGLDQDHYTGKSFIFTGRGLTTLDHARRTEAALYRGGQVYLPAGTQNQDANPRPVSLDHPVNGIIGCFSADNRWLLATASDKTHEL